MFKRLSNSKEFPKLRKFIAIFNYSKVVLRKKVSLHKRTLYYCSFDRSYLYTFKDRVDNCKSKIKRYGIIYSKLSRARKTGILKTRRR